MIRLLHQKDFKEISVTDLVQQADLNRGTFYRHYQYKEDLLDDILDDVTTDLIHSYREPYLGSETFDVSAMNASAVKLFDHVYRHAYFYTLILHSNSLSGMYNQICKVLIKLALQDLTDTRRAEQKVNLELHASYQAYAIFGMIAEWVNGGFKYSSQYMAEQLVEFIHLNQSGVVIRPRISELRLEDYLHFN
ncbi:TetR/AcrR family transcriptional regulator [Paenibacillus sp. PK3_47]|nr:TetR/AcrR family transcriptional regulator [Paenibacillus sp. PK3_47]